MNEISQLAMAVFKRPPRRVAFPGGKSRDAFVADMGDALYVFAKRENEDDAQIEAIVLKALADSGRTPQLVARRGRWIVQECMEGVRLPVLLDQTANEEAREALVSSALSSLASIHEAARSSGLGHRVARIGTEDGWLRGRTGAAKRIAETVGLREPDIDRNWWAAQMDVKRTEFVKWDARPGNAMVADDGVRWFDWEDCGRSTPLDDLAFVLFDEWTNLGPAAQGRLLAEHLPQFAGRMSLDHARHYLRLFAITHTLLRLKMALRFAYRDGKWWDRAYCLAHDKVGVTAAETSRQILRARMLSDGVPQLRSLGPWLDDLGATLQRSLSSVDDANAA